MLRIELKNGESFNTTQMRNYLLTDEYFILSEEMKQFNFNGKARLLKKIEDVFGEKGILILFVFSYEYNSFDFDEFINSNNLYNGDTSKILKGKGIKIKDLIRKSLFKIKYFFEDLLRYISYPIRELIHIKKYLCSIHTSYFFDFEFLPMIYKNLDYYKKIIEKRYVIVGWIERNLKEVDEVKDFCLAYQSVYSLTDEVRQMFGILEESYGKHYTDYSKQLILKKCDELDKDIEEKSKKLVRVVMESQI